MRSPILFPLAALGLALIPEIAAAQGLGSVIRRAAESEVKREADRRTREVTRCVIGADDCPQTSEEASEVTVTSSDVPLGQPAAGQAASDYLLPSEGTATQGSLPTQPFAVPIIPNATVIKSDLQDGAEYLRIIGFSGGTIRYETKTGKFSRTRYRLNGRPATSATLAAVSGPLTTQGLVIDWQCSRREVCGSTAAWSGGRTWASLNGMNMGVAGDVRYFTGHIVREGMPTVYVSVAANPGDAYVDTLEVVE